MAAVFARRAFSTGIRRQCCRQTQGLRQDIKRNPKLYVFGGIASSALAVASYYFGEPPTQAPSGIAMVKTSWWVLYSPEGKHRFLPGSNLSAQPKGAPSAVNVAVVPHSDLPKSLHDKYNKWGKDGY